MKKTLLILAFALFTSFNSFAQQEGFIGEVKLFAGNFAPRGWAFCNGQLLSIAQNQALFSIIGCQYGGDCRTTFALPDLRGRTPVGPGNGPGLSTIQIGQKGGTETETMTALQLPSHTHTAALTTGGIAIPVNTTAGDADEVNPGAGIPANNGEDTYTTGSANGKLGGADIPVTGTITVGNTGGNQAQNNRSPFLGVHYIIALQGVFPSRS
ncbi:tail fiber protein [Nonlabens marinus]|uniref:Microcystin dependent protein n=1 Tax=Nonlabens marinus S1-08 TaxID=1454201 RepID=W8W052_9FLAO|nr:tail fiber protein [Nonlabens marinus]BAO55721.1 microcystin dependent protein [Nonlabens marinus S1-08]